MPIGVTRIGRPNFRAAMKFLTRLKHGQEHATNRMEDMSCQNCIVGFVSCFYNGVEATIVRSCGIQRLKILLMVNSNKMGARNRARITYS